MCLHDLIRKCLHGLQTVYAIKRFLWCAKASFLLVLLFRSACESNILLIQNYLEKNDKSQHFYEWKQCIIILNITQSIKRRHIHDLITLHRKNPINPFIFNSGLEAVFSNLATIKSQFLDFFVWPNSPGSTPQLIIHIDHLKSRCFYTEMNYL